MLETTRQLRRSASRARRGQTLIVAIAVLFVLLFIGALFVAQVARNLVAAGRSRDAQDALSLAEAGVRYCDTQLTYSPEGADWRPAPTPPLTQPGVDDLGITDPDYYWLADRDQNDRPRGFSRVSLPGGRALVRVSYEPHPQDPRSQLLKIEAIGRPGDLGDGLDPTIFVQDQPFTRGLRRELIAYKQIGLTDYLRFITGKDRREQENFIGVPSLGTYVAMVLGDPTIAQAPSGINNDQYLMGGGIRANGNLRIGGDTHIYLNPARPIENVLVSGKVQLEPTRDTNNDGALNNADLQAFVNQPIGPSQTTYAPENAIRSSDDPNRTTNSGLVRDISSQSDRQGYVNNTPRLEPPRIETMADGESVLRYRSLTRDSGQWITISGRRYNTGQAGWGRGVYVDNFADQQRETTRRGVTGSYSLRADWLNPNNQFAQSYWQGPFYRPPGVLIELLGDRIRFTRSDDRFFLRPDGQPITTQGGKVIEIPLDDLERQNIAFPDPTAPGGAVTFPAGTIPTLPHDGDHPNENQNRPFGDANSYGTNLVIMAEGNVRVKGVYGRLTDLRQQTQNPRLSRLHLTIVSGGTAYIEGNVVKGDGYIDTGGVQHLERASTCSILAKDYVCVNTTMFMSPENQTNAFSLFTNPNVENYAAYGTELGIGRQTFDMSWSFGVPPGSYTLPDDSRRLFLLLRHAALPPGPSFINLLINPALVAPGGSPLYPFTDQTTLTPPNTTPRIPPLETYMLGMKYFPPQSPAPATNGYAIAPLFEMRAFSLINDPAFRFTAITNPGFPNTLRFQVDQTAPAQAELYGVPQLAATDYLLGGAAVAPLDIRIEALLYAEDNCFFVIPGYPFNPDPRDTRQNFAATARRASYSVDDMGNVLDNASEKAAKDVYPFFNEPMDARITIFGAVSENYTASQGDQKAWFSRWGYIPTAHGSSGIAIPEDHARVHDPAMAPGTGIEVAYNPGENRTADFRTAQEAQAGITRGLRFVYDPALAMPYLGPTAVQLNGDSTAARDLRYRRAIRSRIWNEQRNSDGAVILPAVQHILPPTPRLPVCPGLLYFGDSERGLG